MPLMEKQRRVRDPKRTDYVVYKRRSRIWLFILILLATLLLYDLGSYLYSNIFEETSDEPEQTDTSAIEQAPTDTTDQEKATEEEEARIAPAPPNDSTLYLTVPRLGIYGHTVRNDRSEAALDLGAVKLPATSFPWQKGDTNTYIACHRLGWPGLESYHQCLNLISRISLNVASHPHKALSAIRRAKARANSRPRKEPQTTGSHSGTYRR